MKTEKQSKNTVKSGRNSHPWAAPPNLVGDEVTSLTSSYLGSQPPGFPSAGTLPLPIEHYLIIAMVNCLVTKKSPNSNWQRAIATDDCFFAVLRDLSRSFALFRDNF